MIVEILRIEQGEAVGTQMIGQVMEGRFACIGNKAEPVSYTHLRAHETVLDLVCRLLLEKKKNKSKHKD